MIGYGCWLKFRVRGFAWFCVGSVRNYRKNTGHGNWKEPPQLPSVANLGSSDKQNSSAQERLTQV